MTTKPWREEITLKQTLGKSRTFTFTTTADTAQNVMLISGAMQEGVKVTFVVDLFDLYVEFDADATTSSMLIPAGTGYAEENIFIGTRISVINATAGQNGRIRGIVWGR